MKVKRNLTYKDFLKYFGKKLDKKSMHDFEKEMMKDAFDEEAYDGLSSLSREEVSSDIYQLQNKFKQDRNKTLIRFQWLKYAVALILLVGIGIVLLFFTNIFNKEQYLADSTETETLITDSSLMTTQIAKESSSDTVVSSKKIEAYNIYKEELTDEEKRDTSVTESSRRLDIKSKGLGKISIDSSSIELPTDIFSVKKRRIYGTVTGVDDKFPIPGVIVTVPGTRISTITDFEGNYELIVSDTSSDLRYAYIGMETQDIELDENDKVNVKMNVSTEILDEVVIKGSAIKQERTLTGSSPVTDISEDMTINKSSGELTETTKGEIADVSIEKRLKDYQKTIRGQVKGSEDGLPIPGVTILVPGTTYGTITDSVGRYEIIVDKDEDKLRYSFVGMESIDVKIREMEEVNVKLKPSYQALSEVVVSGYSDNYKGVGGSGRTLTGLPDHTRTEFRAKPKQGYSQYKKDIIRLIDYSLLTDFPGKHKLKIKVWVSETGEITKLIVSGAPHKIVENEIKRVIINLGKWNAAISNNLTVSSEVKFSLRIEIK